MLKIKINKAFSLSEMLLTLGIIGIVAAMVVPNLLESNKQMEAEASIGTGYSLLSNALYAATKEYQVSSVRGVCATGDNICFKDFLLTKLDYVKDCGISLNRTCWTTYEYSDGSSASVSGASIMLKNGMSVLIEWLASNCDGANNDKCGRISIDTNGPKGPNRWGKDTFAFHLWENTLVPYGLSSDSGNKQTCNKNDKGAYAGFGCSSKYLSRKR